jgi:hypothetical protein
MSDFAELWLSFVASLIVDLDAILESRAIDSERKRAFNEFASIDYEVEFG